MKFIVCVSTGTARLNRLNPIGGNLSHNAGLVVPVLATRFGHRAAAVTADRPIVKGR